MNKYIIGIDGYASTGKGTVASILAKKLGILHIDSGAIYRAGGYYACINNIDIEEEKIIEMIKNINIELKHEEGMQKVYLNCEDYTKYLRSKEATEYSSKIAVIGSYRNMVNDILRNTAKNYSVITEGRDICSVVFPSADIKFFLTASVEERTRRRLLEYIQKGINISENEVRKSICERDERDSNRVVAPLKILEDSIVIDTSDKTIDEVVEIMFNIIKEKVEV